MQRFPEEDTNTSSHKKIYKAIRTRKSTLEGSSPTPKKQFSRKMIQSKGLNESSPSAATQVALPREEFQLSGKRGQLPEGVKVLKYLKKSETCLKTQKSIIFFESESVSEKFSVYDEQVYLSNSKVLKADHDLDDYSTSLTQMKMCKVMLEQELEAAFSELGLIKNT